MGQIGKIVGDVERLDADNLSAINGFTDKPSDKVTLKLPVSDILNGHFKMKTYRHDDESNITSMQEIML